MSDGNTARMSRLSGVLWLGAVASFLIGAGGHVWHKWLRPDAPGANWMMSDGYVSAHAIWWGLLGLSVVLGITAHLIGKRADRGKPDS